MRAVSSKRLSSESMRKQEYSPWAVVDMQLDIWSGREHHEIAQKNDQMMGGRLGARKSPLGSSCVTPEANRFLSEEDHQNA